MKNIRFFLSENFPFLVVKCSIYLNRRVFVMSEHQDQPADLCSLIRIFTGCILDSQGCKVSSCG